MGGMWFSVDNITAWLTDENNQPAIKTTTFLPWVVDMTLLTWGQGMNLSNPPKGRAITHDDGFIHPGDGQDLRDSLKIDAVHQTDRQPK